MTEDQLDYVHLYIAKKEVDITGAVHLHVIRDEEIAHLTAGDEFITLLTKVEI